MEALAHWLIESLPPNPEQPAIVHGDFKLYNLMFDPGDPGRPVAVFDWEMAALGDPSSILGILLACWSANAASKRDTLNSDYARLADAGDLVEDTPRAAAAT